MKALFFILFDLPLFPSLLPTSFVGLPPIPTADCILWGMAPHLRLIELIKKPILAAG